MSRGIKITLIVLAIIVGILIAGAASADLFDPEQQTRIRRIFELIDIGIEQSDKIDSDRIEFFQQCHRPGLELVQQNLVAHCIAQARKLAVMYGEEKQTIDEMRPLAEEAIAHVAFFTNEWWNDVKIYLKWDIFPKYAASGIRFFEANVQLLEILQGARFPENIAALIEQESPLLNDLAAGPLKESQEIFEEYEAAYQEYLKLAQQIGTPSGEEPTLPQQTLEMPSSKN